jgi:RimJ/RimL family protein N-acetyltransferase
VTRRPRHPLRVLESRRLTLVAATPDIIQADLAGGGELADALGAEVPDNWPPELFDTPAMWAYRDQLRDPEAHGWSAWYLLLDTGQDRQLAGLCAFKGRPDRAGSAEISYSLLQQFRVLGLATEAVSRLVVWAFSHQAVSEVSAETFPHLSRSIRVLEKNGFKLAGPGSEQGVVRYVVHRSDRR